MEQFSEYLLNISRRIQTPKRTGKIPSQPGRTKERKKKRGIKKGTSNPGRKLKVRRGLPTQKTSLTMGKSAGTKRNLQGIKGEHSRQSAEGRTK